MLVLLLCHSIGHPLQMNHVFPTTRNSATAVVEGIQPRNIPRSVSSEENVLHRHRISESRCSRLRLCRQLLPSVNTSTALFFAVDDRTSECDSACRCKPVQICTILLATCGSGVKKQASPFPFFPIPSHSSRHLGVQFCTNRRRCRCFGPPKKSGGSDSWRPIGRTPSPPSFG